VHDWLKAGLLCVVLQLFSSVHVRVCVPAVHADHPEQVQDSVHSCASTQLEVSKLHVGVHPKAPPVKPRLAQVAPPRLVPSHSSPASTTPLPQLLCGEGACVVKVLSELNGEVLPSASVERTR
jgi:hypothetical protein